MVPAITEATGTISVIHKIPERTGKHEIKELQKRATFGAAHRLGKVLMKRYRTCSMGIGITCSMNCDCSIAATVGTVVYTFALCTLYALTRSERQGDFLWETSAVRRIRYRSLYFILFIYLLICI